MNIFRLVSLDKINNQYTHSSKFVYVKGSLLVAPGGRYKNVLVFIVNGVSCKLQLLFGSQVRSQT